MYEIQDTMYINYMHTNPMFIGFTRNFNTPINETPRSAPIPLCVSGNIRSTWCKYTNFPAYYAFFMEIFCIKIQFKH